MAIQFSTAYRNALLDQFETSVGTGPVLTLRSGAAPADCAAANSGTVLATLTLPSDWMAPAASGSKANAPIGNGQGLAGCDLYEPFSCDGEGTQSKRFIKGTILDADSNAVSGAIVQGYVTATDAYVGEVQSNQDGTYTLGTETLPGVAHYLVAYKPGSPDIAGTTVNTLTSTNVDGS